MSRIATYLLIVIVYFSLMRVFSYSDIEFVNGTNKVAVGSKNLQFKANLSLDNTKVNWYLVINGLRSTIARIETISNKQECDVLYTSTTLKSSSCEWRESYYTPVIILAQIPANVTAILYEYDNFQQKISYLSSIYCPNLDEGPHLSVITNKNAVYNQQARFSCSKGELYDESSINSDYYRTCQIDATWSGEIPECRLVGPTSLSKVMFETVEHGKPLMVYLNFTASPAINKNTTLLTKLSSTSNITPVNSTRYKIVNWTSSYQAMAWYIDNFTNEYEGQYIFTAWSTVAPQVMVKSFELKVDSSSTIPVTTTASSCHCDCKTDNGSSIGPTVGIIVAVVLVIMVVGVAVFVVKRRLHTQSDSNKPNYKEPSIYENQLASTDIESKYEKKIPSSGQKELYENPMPTYANTQHNY